MIDYFIIKYRAVYFISLVVGIVLIIFSQLFNSQFISLATVSAWMCFLGFLIYRKSFINYEESDADYFYYLGFIYTIFTLAISFVFITFQQTDDGIIDNKQIIKSFGFGLITTFIGLSGRVLLYQIFERQTTGAEDAVQRISVIGDRFARQLGGLTVSMKANLEEITGAYNSSALSLNKATVELAKEISSLSLEMQDLKKKTSKSIIQLEKSSESYTETINNKLQELTSVMDGFILSVSSATTATNIFTGSIENLKLFDNLSIEIKSTEDALQNFSKNILNAGLDASNLSIDIEKSVNFSIEMHSKLTDNLNNIFNTIQSQKALIDQFLNLLQKDVVIYTDNTNAIAHFSETAINATETLEEFSLKINSISNSVSTVSLLPNIFNDLFNSQKSFVDNLDLVIKTSAGLSIELSSTVKTVIEQLKLGADGYIEASKNQEKLISNLQISQSAVADTHSSLIQSIRALKDEFQ